MDQLLGVTYSSLVILHVFEFSKVLFFELLPTFLQRRIRSDTDLIRGGVLGFRHTY